MERGNMRGHRGVVFVALGLILGSLFVFGSPDTQEARAYEPEEQQLLDLINGYRQANGVAPLAPSGPLSSAAKRHSLDMATYGFFSHASEASSYYPAGSNYWDRLALEGFPNPDTAENIGMGTAAAAFENWRLSPVHNANMLNPNFTSIGVGQASPYWTITLG